MESTSSSVQSSFYFPQKGFTTFVCVCYVSNAEFSDWKKKALGLKNGKRKKKIEIKSYVKKKKNTQKNN